MGLVVSHFSHFQFFKCAKKKYTQGPSKGYIIPGVINGVIQASFQGVILVIIQGVIYVLIYSVIHNEVHDKIHNSCCFQGVI